MQNLSAGQVLILDRIREKIIVVMQIGKFVDGLRGIITKDGGIIPALGKNYMSFSEGLRRDLQAFYEMADRRPSKVPDLASYLKQKAEEKKRAGGGNGPERVQDGPRTEIPGPEGKDEPVDVEEEQPGEDGEA